MNGIHKKSTAVSYLEEIRICLRKDNFKPTTCTLFGSKVPDYRSCGKGNAKQVKVFYRTSS